ncbi:Gfo/Idh/MocA family protein [Poriferisphaera sp. WC338]|uniref:Gfo/Idh/MocA family protein n=1 Tax=Poriferisphaera sp. WC338 TaxID=3425129 RepID=UPI003D818C8B
MDRHRYALVGAGGRSRMFIDAIYGSYADQAELVGLCDISSQRMATWNQFIAETYEAPPVQTFMADQFDAMIAETKPRTVIVTSVDVTHHEYIIRALELGCDVITEKPMTIDEDKAQQILDAVDRTSGNVRVTFNYRYMPTYSKLREVVASGEIGEPTLVNFQWYLDTSHGADYFRRWHREKRYSGGLLVHKSTHHFDLVNFIIGAHPETVFAMGDLSFYGEKNAKARGEQYDFERYQDLENPMSDRFGLDLRDDMLKTIYLDAEEDSGYIRDRNVFGGEEKWPITSEDTMSVIARYTNGTQLNYTLVAYSPWEGERITITGTKGQIEYFGRGAGHLIAGQSEEELAAQQYQGEQYIRLQKMFEPAQELEIPEGKGAHGGGDAILLDRIFNQNAKDDPLERDANHHDGASSILLGVAANKAIETGRSVQIADLTRECVR